MTRSGKTELAEPIAVRPTSETGERERERQRETHTHTHINVCELILCVLFLIVVQRCTRPTPNGSSPTETCPSSSTSGVTLWSVILYIYTLHTAT